MKDNRKREKALGTLERGDSGWREATRIVHGGPKPSEQSGVINPPIYRASTIIYDTVDAYIDRHKGLYGDVIYGLYGTRSTYALAEAIAELEQGSATVITSSGTSAIALTLSAFVEAGDHLLVADAKIPVRNPLEIRRGY